MRKIYIILLLSVAFVANAQQDPQFTQFFLNKLNYNPAFAGTEEKICAMGIYRTQWLGFGGTGNNQLDVPSGESPTTFLASINGPIRQKFGVGLNIYSDQQGFERLVNPMLSLSYIHTFQNQSKLSGGLGIGIMQKSVEGNKYRPKELNDPNIPTNNVSGSTLDINGGLYYTMPTLWIFNNFYTGLSMTHLNTGEITYGSVTNNLVAHTYFMTGAAYQLNSSLDIEPNILVKRDRAKFSTDINVMATFNNKFRGGLTYRTEDAASILIGFKFNDNMQMGYSYDITTSNIIEYSSGSHEILFKYCFMPKFETKEKPIVPRLTPRFL
jgi:type IX secretion system PorP/SprF family membrane protein